MPQVQVKVVEARGLPAADMNGKSDPFVVLATPDTKAKTKVVQKNLNPTFNEQFTMVVNDPLRDAIGFIVYDWDRVGAPDLLGFACVMVNDLQPRVDKDVWLQLHKKGKTPGKDKKKKGKPAPAHGGAPAAHPKPQGPPAGQLHIVLTALDFGPLAPQMGGPGMPPPGQYGAPPPGQYGAPPPGQYAPPPGQYGAPPPGQYGAPPPGQYGAPPPGQYGAPPPGQYAPPPGQYGAPPPGQYGAPPPQGGYAPQPYGGMMPQQPQQMLPGLTPYTGRAPQGWKAVAGQLSPDKTPEEKAAKSAKKTGKKVLKGLGSFLGAVADAASE